MVYIYVHQQISELNIKGAKNEFESEYFNRSLNIGTSVNMPTI